MCSFSLSSMAYTNNDEYDGFVTPEMVKETEENTRRLIEKGNAIIQMYEEGIAPMKSYHMDFVHLYQDDPRWANKYLPCKETGHTYGKVGCAMTSYAMCMAWFEAPGLKEYTPVAVAERYGSEACNFSSATLIGQYKGRSYTAVGSNDNYTEAEKIAAIIGAIADNDPSIIKFTKNGGAHFVIAYGFNDASGTMQVCIRDPEGDYDYPYISTYLNKGWTLSQFVTVS